ncbi:toxin-antitoxin system YwqK family antitoxin [Chitinophaga eiseniae]|uniref:MORN repeat variant n=1 Tax=Chitinophaga eiseniae TaxID=634771 RepID=A0A847SU79_9BACT|nr:hypothetical protein [Chitinophaga eiseniae]NLR81199.1 hypothetical protein [Chitinophaga eiseniae]
MKFVKRQFLGYCFIVTLLTGCWGNKKTYIERISGGDQYFLLKKVFNEKGVLIEEVRLNVDSVPDGRYREFFSNGQTKCKGFYRNGIKDSVWTYYSGNGNIKEERKWFDGKEFGEQKVYFDNGRIEQYSFNNLSGEKIFSAAYDSAGKIIKWDGTPIYSAFNAGRLKVNQRFELYCFIGIPPGTDLKVKVEEREGASNILFQKEYGQDNIINLYFSKKIAVEQECRKKGKFAWLVYVDHSYNGIVKSDTIHLDLSVE